MDPDKKKIANSLTAALSEVMKIIKNFIAQYIYIRGQITDKNLK